MSKMDESKIYVAFLAMIENLDNYKFFKNADGTHAIDVEIKGYKHSFKADDIYNLMNHNSRKDCALIFTSVNLQHGLPKQK